MIRVKLTNEVFLFLFTFLIKLDQDRKEQHEKDLNSRKEYNQVSINRKSNKLQQITLSSRHVVKSIHFLCFYFILLFCVFLSIR